MLEPHQSRFWQIALQTGLVDADRLMACWNQILPEKRTPDAIDRRLARRLVEAGHLKRWQAQQLMSGLRPQALWYGKYVLEDVIGHGGMGRVYLARDSRLGRKVAVKILSRERMSNPRAIARFRREAMVGAQLQHENLVRVYDEGEVNGNLYLVMEFIEGKAVGRLIVERGPLPPPVAARIARQTALGLEHVNQKGLIHRDVNPMNILITVDGLAKLTDLGLALDLGEHGNAVTREGATVGTFDYISPEQARHSRAIDIRSDIYSLGCTLYQMLTGRVPFPQPSLPEKLYAHQALNADPPSELVPGIPAGLEAVLRKMMSKRPEDRYSRPLEVADALEPFQCGPLPLRQIEAGPELPTWAVHPEAEVGDSSGEEPTQVQPPAFLAGSTPSSTAGPVLDPASAPASTEAADGLTALLKIDTGPPAPLSEPRIVARPARAPAAGRLRDRRWLIATALSASALLALGVWIGPGWIWAHRTPGQDIGAPMSAGLLPVSPTDPLVIHWFQDDSETAAAGLQDAIRQVAGKPAEVVLRTDGQLELPADTALVVETGRVLIRADGASRPKLVVTRTGDAPLFRVDPLASLELDGLTIELSSWRPESVGGAWASLIVAHGDLTLRRCAVTATGPDRKFRVMTARGQRTDIEDCSFGDFPWALEFVPASGTQIRLRNCLLLCQVPDDPAPGWALSLAIPPEGRRSKAPRRIVIDRCTVVCAGLLAVEDVSAVAPLKVEVLRTAVQAKSLLGWAGLSQFPTGLSWEGHDNRYGLPGSGPWVVPGPGQAEGIPNAPTSLESWTRGGLADVGTRRIGPLQFRTASTAPLLERPVSEFRLDDHEKPDLGIDPTTVGP